MIIQKFKKLLIGHKRNDLRFFLRDYFIEYSGIINSIWDKEKDKSIIKDITDFYKIDDDYLLNENIKNFFKNKKVN